MPALPRWGALALAVVLPAAGLLGGCAGSGDRLANMVTPYRPEVVQGNVVTREQVDALKPGMSRQQVREILGTPLMTSLFHANRWEYVFTIRRQGVQDQARHLTVFFEQDRFDRTEGDEMPTEQEFIASLSSSVKDVKVPELEATEAQLERFPRARAEADKASPQPAAPPAGTRYPPLETPGR
ncbi:outer membrane protein assembly factor BamE [Comamonas badia]|uniref:outer membrane protein assembly factor BamE n=1 Tax=Comamonas badia TaxID=265291 RepID=UPI00387E0FCB